jgi:hypothetical protein
METEPEAVLGLLLAKAGRSGEVTAVDPLPGGRNNRVYRVETLSEPVVLKLYHADPRDTRDRLGHEWSFLQYAWKRGVRAVPEPLAHAPDHYAALYSFVAGRKLTAQEIGSDQIGEAVDFVLALNAARADLPELPAASEACFSLAEHFETVERRVRRLEVLNTSRPEAEEAGTFIRDRLCPIWARVRARAERASEAAGLSLNNILQEDEICLSPSDFGFHNALTQGGRTTFIDFEYAGRDDPAKLASDFFCQPDVPIQLEHHSGFVEQLVEGLGLAEIHACRCRLLLDSYRVKWACIMLNEFLPLGFARRAFADRSPPQDRWDAQLAAAERKLSEIDV